MRGHGIQQSTARQRPAERQKGEDDDSDQTGCLDAGQTGMEPRAVSLEKPYLNSATGATVREVALPGNTAALLLAPVAR